MLINVISTKVTKNIKKNFDMYMYNEHIDLFN